MRKALIVVIMVIFSSLLNLNCPPNVTALDFTKDQNLSAANASFINETMNWRYAISLDMVGDLNGDHYDDIAIMSERTSPTENTLVEIIFGKKDGWHKDTNFTEVNASYTTMYRGDMGTVVGLGDINGDGYDDMGFSVPRHGQDDGRVYIILGKRDGWGLGLDQDDVDIVIYGQFHDYLGLSFVGAGDVNGDGYADFLISADADRANDNFQTYLFFGKPQWPPSTTTGQADVTIGYGMTEQMPIGTRYYLSGEGDVNGDGYDDFLLNLPYNDTNGMNTGVVRLFLGNSSGWAKNMNHTMSDAVFVGVRGSDLAGYISSISQDVNGDGFDDIMISAIGNGDCTPTHGQVYVIYGNESGFSGNYNLSDIADASFSYKGSANSYIGTMVRSAGDVDGDGFEDVLLGDKYHDENGLNSGKTYLSLGNASGWSMCMKAEDSVVSFAGEFDGDESGALVAGGGDVNGDGLDDIMVNAPMNVTKFNNNGKAYLIFPDSNLRPTTVQSVKAYMDPAYSTEIFTAQVNDTIYVEMKATDADPSRANIGLLNVSSTATYPLGIILKVRETGPNTGTFRGSFVISNRTHGRNEWIGASSGESVMVTSLTDPSKQAIIAINIPLQLRPFYDLTEATEDEEYLVHYWSVGSASVSDWAFETNASWLSWDGVGHDVVGTPDNGDVGLHWVKISITDGMGHGDEHNFTIDVSNTPPLIITTDVTAIDEDVLYLVDYNSSDDGQGHVTWHLGTNASWLDINDTTGDLTGTPNNDDLGTWRVNVSVDDGNGGMDSHNFTITVANVNDPPVILTDDVLIAIEDTPYNVTYSAMDVDPGDEISWDLATNATWLNMDRDKAFLYGQPVNKDVGKYWVNVTATDMNDGVGFHNFTLEVRNTNDPPTFTSIPVTDARVPFEYRYQATATDMDPNDILEFVLKEGPEGMEINGTTGIVTWVPSILQVGINPVVVEAVDSNSTVSQAFDITVTASAATLASPANGSAFTTRTPELLWTFPGSDTGGIVFDVVLDTQEPPEQVHAQVVNGTSLLVTEPLAENTTYYWQVVPRNGNVTGRPSPVFSFRIVPSLVPKYIVVLDLSKDEIEVKRGDVTHIDIVLTNSGNVPGNIVVSIAGDLSASMFEFQDRVWTTPDGSETIRVNITVPETFLFRSYDMVVKATFGNYSTEKTLRITVVKPAAPGTEAPLWSNPAFIGGLLALIIALAVIGMAYSAHRRGRAESELAAARAAADEVEDFEIDEIFSIYRDGRLISHVTGKGSGIDDQIFAGMLVAVQGFVKDSFRTEEGLSSFEYGTRKILLERGNHTYLVVALSGTEPRMLRPQMRELVQKVEGLYAGKIETWDGDQAAFKDINNYLVPLFGIKEGLKIKKEKEEVKVKSGIEFFGGYVRLKAAVKNELAAPIKDVVMTVSFDDRTLRLSHIEPEYPMKGSAIHLDPILPDEKRTVALYLDPLICQESHVDVKVAYTDDYGNKGEAHMKRRPVDIVCPLFYTPETINVAMLKRLLGSMSYSDNRIYSMSPEVDHKAVLARAKEAVKRHDVQLVRDLTEEEPFEGESWFYGSTSETNEELIIKLAIRKKPSTLEIFVASSNLATLTGLLAELGKNIKDSMWSVGIGLEPTTDSDLKEQLDRIGRLLDKHGG